MATTVGFVSEKGGVGKTTACYHIARALQIYHDKRVLVVDTDYQRGGISCRFVPSLIEDFRSGSLSGKTLYVKYRELYAGSEPTDGVDIISTSSKIGLLAADPRLSQVSADKMPASNNIRENNRRLWNHLSLIRRILRPLRDDYDYILIDSHPEVSDLLRSVIYASDFIVSPVKLDLQSAIGVPTALQVLNEVNDDVAMMRQSMDGLEEHGPASFAGAIGMMAREWGGILKATERAQYRRLAVSTGIFENYVTEGDGLRQAAEARTSVFNITGSNAERQAEQFRDVTREFLQKCP